jgi:hypothetical protein
MFDFQFQCGLQVVLPPRNPPLMSGFQLATKFLWGFIDQGDLEGRTSVIYVEVAELGLNTRELTFSRI